MGFHNLVNTQYFSEAANDMRKNKWVAYTKAPRGSREYNEYWEEQEKRCILGYSVGDMWIPGKFYYYLNFTPIWRIPDSALGLAMIKENENIKGEVSNPIMKKILDFPKFMEIDYEWWNFKHIAWYGGEFMGIKSPGAKHMCALKTRGAGWSYKEASEGNWNYNFEYGSKSYYFASTKEYLIKDGILSKVKEMLDFTNKYIPRWKKNRMKRDNPMYYKASYLTKDGKEDGPGSEIFGLIIKDPDLVRGKRGIKITYEEGGSFKNLKRALGISVGNIKDGGFTVGQISVFGTGGEEGEDIEGLDDVFRNPHGYDMLAFPNVWEPDMEQSECGLFIPCYRANIKFMDGDGNVDVEGAIANEEGEREKKRKLPDPKEIDMRIAEYPYTPGDALQRLTLNPFNVTEINKRINYMKSHWTEIQMLLRHGDIGLNKDGEPEFTVNPDARPIQTYPHKAGDDLSGCVTVYEEPYKNEHGVTPEGMYFITVDPAYKEETDDITSLFCLRVWKNYNIHDPKNEGLPIAWFRGRREDFEAIYQIIFLLADWYNCKIQSEIAGGGQGIIDYAKRPDVRKSEKLEYEPEMVMAAEDAKKQTGNATRFMNMPDEKKRMGLTYLVGWTMQKRAGYDDGRVVRNIDRYMDIVGLIEMTKWKPKINADTISADILAMFMLKEYVFKAEEQAASDPNSFFNRTLFGERPVNADSMVPFTEEEEYSGYVPLY